MPFSAINLSHYPKAQTQLSSHITNITHRGTEKILQSYVNISQMKIQQQIKHQARPHLLQRWLQKDLIFVKHTFHTKQKIFHLLGSSLLRYNYSSIDLTDTIATYDSIQK